jgi:hypothetical protein
VSAARAKACVCMQTYIASPGRVTASETIAKDDLRNDDNIGIILVETYMHACMAPWMRCMVSILDETPSIAVPRWRFPHPSRKQPCSHAGTAGQASFDNTTYSLVDYSLWLRRGPHAIPSHPMPNLVAASLRSVGWQTRSWRASPQSFRSRQNKSSVARSFPFTRAPGPCIGR